MTRFLGSHPSRDVSRRQHWYSLVWGVVVIAWFACLLLFPGEHEDYGMPFLKPTEIVLGLMLAAQGAAGLLWEDRPVLALWVSALAGLLFVPFVFLVSASMYVWMGVLGVGVWAVVLVLVVVWDEARRRRRTL